MGSNIMSEPLKVIKIDIGNGIWEVRNAVTNKIIGHDYTSNEDWNEL